MTCVDTVIVEKSQKTKSYLCKNPSRCNNYYIFREWQNKKRKYVKGKHRIKNVEELFNTKLVWLYGKATSPMMLKNQKIGYIDELLKRGLFVAEEKEKNK